jgi:hypothetical protein
MGSVALRPWEAERQCVESTFVVDFEEWSLMS